MRPIADVITELLSQIDGAEDAAQLARIRKCISTHFPPALKTNILAEDFQNGTLYLKIHSPAWRAELTLLQNKIITQLNHLLTTTAATPPVITNCIIKG